MDIDLAKGIYIQQIFYYFFIYSSKSCSFQDIHLYYGDLPDDPTVIKRRVILQPLTVDRIQIDLLDGKPDILMKFDLIGLATKKAYKANPILDEKEYLECNMQNKRQVIRQAFLL